ncbi:MAG: Fur family transcriptional regulator [Burkholderiaceae bacterium]
MKAGQRTAPELTRNQALVLAALNEADSPQSAYALLEQLRDAGIRAPLQVYRALDKLLELGRVHRLESLNAFVACQHPAGDAHGLTAFAICNDCGQVEEFHDDSVGRRLTRWAGERAFSLHKAAIELRGQCARCRANPQSR